MAKADSFNLKPELLPLMAAAIQAAGPVVAAQVEKGHFPINTSSEEYASWIAAIAASTITKLTPVR